MSQIIKIIALLFEGIWFLSLLHFTYGCSIRLPGTLVGTEVSSTETISLESQDDFDSQYPSHESELQLINTQNRLLSTALHVIVEFVVKSGGLEFICPQNYDNSTFNKNATYPDPLDCQKYYECGENQNLTQKTCDPDLGFDNATNSCIPRDKVPLCGLVQSRPDLNCNSTGLQIYNGDCTKFVLCTKRKYAFVSSCHEGDFFDQNLLICLPNTQSLC